MNVDIIAGLLGQKMTESTRIDRQLNHNSIQRAKGGQLTEGNSPSMPVPIIMLLCQVMGLTFDKNVHTFKLTHCR